MIMESTEVNEYSAGGVVLHQGKVLVIQHARGEWIMPKGHLEEGETEAEAALREILEETNIRCCLTSELGQTNYDFNRGQVVVHKHVTWYLAIPVGEVEEARPQVEEGITGLEWLVPDEALQRLTFDLDRKIVRKALNL